MGSEAVSDEVLVTEQWAANEAASGSSDAASHGAADRAGGAEGEAIGAGGVATGETTDGRVVPPVELGEPPAGTGADPAAAGVRLALPGVVGLLVIRADPERVALADALFATLGLALPERLSSATADGLCLRWMSPDEWLLSCPVERAFDIERRLRAALDGSFSISNVSGGYAVLQIEGPAVRELLAKSTSLDVDPRVFGPGRVASTVFAKTTATLRNAGTPTGTGAANGDARSDGTGGAPGDAPARGSDDGRYELICRRSFADYVVRWIAESAREHGLAVV